MCPCFSGSWFESCTVFTHTPRKNPRPWGHGADQAGGSGFASGLMEVEIGNANQPWSWPWLSGQSARQRTELVDESQRMDGFSGHAANPAGDGDNTAPAATAAAAAAAGPGSAESVGLAAERLRLASEQLIDLQALATTLADMLPYVLLLSSLFVLKFSAQLTQLLWLTYIQLVVNREMRCQVARKKDVQMEGLLRIAFVVAMTLLGFPLIFPDCSWLTRGLLLLPPFDHSSTVSTTLRIMVTDAYARLLWTYPKLSVLLGSKLSNLLETGPKSSAAAASRAQGRILTLAEHLLLLYRNALPVQVWYSYLLHSSSSGVLSSLLTGTYLVLKLGDLKHHGMMLLLAGRIALRRGASWGTYVAAGPQAPETATHASPREQAATGRSQPSQRRRQMALSPVILSLAANLPVRWQQPQEQQQQQQQQGPAAESAAGSAAAGVDVEAGLCRNVNTEGTCPVCHDTVTVGVRLECSHVFCEDCICEWLERHRTCPMCRAEVKPPGLTTHGDGASSLLPVMF